MHAGISTFGMLSSACAFPKDFVSMRKKAMMLILKEGKLCCAKNRQANETDVHKVASIQDEINCRTWLLD